MTKKRIFLFLIISSVYSAKGQNASKNSASSFLGSAKLSGTEQLDSSLSKYSVFFTGESHNHPSINAQIELSMIEYLNSKAGVRNLMIELGFSRGYMVNQYINGDTSYMDDLKTITNEQYIEFFKKLRALNEKLPSDKKITVHGVDIERFSLEGPMLLKKLLPSNKNMPANIELPIEVIKSYAYYNSVKYSQYQYIDEENDYYDEERNYGFSDRKTIDTLIRDYLRYKGDFRAYLGDSFMLFDKIFNSMIEYRKWQNYSSTFYQEIYRERTIYENISSLMLADTSGKFYGQFGRCHTRYDGDIYECRWYNFSSVAKRLNEGIAKSKTCTVGIFYRNDNHNGYFKDDNVNSEVNKYLSIPCSNENVIKKINRTDSILLKHFNFILISNICRVDQKRMKSNEWLTSNNKFDSKVVMDIGFGFSYFNLNNLNNGLLLADQQFSNQIKNIHLGFSNIEDNSYSSIKFDFLLQQSARKGQLKYLLNGYGISEEMGYAAYIGKSFVMSFYMGFAFQRFSLKAVNDSLEFAISPVFTPLKDYKYINNSFALGGGIDLKLALSPGIGLFIKSRYLWDFSKKHWNNNGQLDGNSPSTSLSNYNLIGGISFLIGNP